MEMDFSNRSNYQSVPIIKVPIIEGRLYTKDAGKSGELECMGYINAQMIDEDKTDVVQVYFCEFTKKCLLAGNAMIKLQVTPDLSKMKAAVARTSINRRTQQRPDMLLLGRKIPTNLSAPTSNPKDEEAV